MRITRTAALVSVCFASSIAFASPTPSTPKAASYLAQEAETNPALAKSFATLTAPIANKAEWVKSYGTATPSVAVELDGQPYLLFSGCKPHDCPAETYVVLYDMKSKQMVAGAYVVNTFKDGSAVSSTIEWLGSPNFDQTTLLGQTLY